MSNEFDLGRVRCTCLWCGEKFWGKRISNVYCCSAHKQRVYRWRKHLANLNKEIEERIVTVADYLDYGQSTPTAIAVLKRVTEKVRDQMIAHKVKNVR